MGFAAFSDLSGHSLMVKLTGTNLEALLTWGSGKTQYACSLESEGPGLIHCKKFRGIRSLEELAGLPWRDVLVGAVKTAGDELAGLRGRMDLPDPGRGG